MKKIFLSFIMILPFLVSAQDFLGHRIYSRVYNVKYGIDTGSIFLIENDSVNYFVTAKHLFKNLSNNDTLTVEIYKESEWQILKGTLMFHENKNIDIALIKPINFEFVSGIDLIQFPPLLGDEGFFLGFPFNLRDTLNQKANQGFPMPLIKKAVYSGDFNNNGVRISLLDGHNNPGFSGGPIFLKNRLKKGGDRWFLFGVISGYINDRKEISTPNGNIIFNENSGIIMSYNTNYIKEIIKKNKTLENK